MSSFREALGELGKGLRAVRGPVGYMGALAIGLGAIGYAGPPILGLEAGVVASGDTGMQVGVIEPQDQQAAELLAGVQAVNAAAELSF